MQAQVWFYASDTVSSSKFPFPLSTPFPNDLFPTSPGNWIAQNPSSYILTASNMEHFQSFLKFHWTGSTSFTCIDRDESGAIASATNWKPSNSKPDWSVQMWWTESSPRHLQSASYGLFTTWTCWVQRISGRISSGMPDYSRLVQF